MVSDYEAAVERRRNDPELWSILAAMTSPEPDGEKARKSKFNPSVPRGWTLIERLLKVHDLAAEEPDFIRLALDGLGAMRQANGLGWDVRRLGPQGGHSKPMAVPAVEVLAFSG